MRAGEALGLLAGLRQREGVGVVAEREQDGHGEGGARGQPGADGERAGDPEGAAGGGWLEPEESGRQEGLVGNRGGAAQGDLERRAGNWSESTPTRKLPGLAREGDLGGEADGHGQREPAVVVGVVADDGDASGGAGGGHAPQLDAGRHGLDRRGRLGSRSCDGRAQWTAEWGQDHRAGGHRAGALHLHDAGRRRGRRCCGSSAPRRVRSSAAPRRAPQRPRRTGTC